MCVNSLPKTVTRQRRDCDLNPGFSAPESSTLTTRLPSHRFRNYRSIFPTRRALSSKPDDRPSAYYAVSTKMFKYDAKSLLRCDKNKYEVVVIA